MKKESLENVLSYALAAKEKPSEELNHQLLQKAKERIEMSHKEINDCENEFKRREEMHRRRKRKSGFSTAAAIIAAVFCAGSLSAVAAWKYLLPQQVAGVQSDRLAAAFAGEDAVMVNETQEIAGYRITFLGMVSGEGLTESIINSGQEFLANQTYTVVAIEHADGTPMPDTSADEYGNIDFFITPAIRGYNPVWYNAITLSASETGSAGYMDMVENGVLYRLSECQNMEVFADHELYLCVSESTFFDKDAYLYDEASGQLSRNPEYDKVNALFSLPMDPAKADAETAEKILADVDVPDQIETNADEGTADNVNIDVAEGSSQLAPVRVSEMSEEEKNAVIQEMVAIELEMAKEAAAAEGSELTQEEIDAITARVIEMETYIMQVEEAMEPQGIGIDEYAECIESTVQILQPDADGMIHYAYRLENGGAGSGSVCLKEYFEMYPDLKTGFLPNSLGYSFSENGMEDLRMETYWLNEDGSVTFAVYVPREEYK